MIITGIVAGVKALVMHLAATDPHWWMQALICGGILGPVAAVTVILVRANSPEIRRREQEEINRR
jgi:hypothetical protein